MTTIQRIVTILVVVLGTMITRFVPFFIFPEGKTPPAFITYLGTVLPELIAIGFISILHKWKKNTLLSIAAGTVLYMVLVQVCFR